MNTEYKGVVNAIGNYTSTISCLEAAQLLFPILPRLDFIVQECKAIISAKSPSNPKNLTDNEVFALALYTYDLGLNGEREENFYYRMNQMLQERSVHKMIKWKDYLFHLQKALSKLPNEECQVYRGIPHNEIFTNYKLGRKIHYSAFTSTTTNKSEAIEYAGDSGVVLCIQVFNGKSIKDYSVFPREDEILLSPNMSFFISKALFKEGDTQFIELIQEHPDGTFVF